MSKKRVHEIAKELKGHGIELDNKEVVNELAALGYDVKSHSSSLDDDQANAAVQKILDKRKPKQASPPVTAKGFVVRRKVGAPAGAGSADSGHEMSEQAQGGAEPPQAAFEPSSAAEAQAPVEAAPAAPPAAVEAPRAPESRPVEPPPAPSAPEAPAVTATPVTPPSSAAPVAEAPEAPAPAAAAAPPAPVAETPRA